MEKSRDKLHKRRIRLGGAASLAEEKIVALRMQLDNYSSRFLPHENIEDGDVDFLARISSAAIQKLAHERRDIAEAKISHLKREQSRLRSLQRKLTTKEDKEDLNIRFRNLLRMNVEKIGATGVNLTGVDSPLNHVRLFGSGGAAEGTRAALAYYAAVIVMAQNADNEVIPPFIVDTPNQHEQTFDNYEAALKLVQDCAADAQTIICAMDTDAIQPYKTIGKVIWLDPKTRLLDKTQYNKIWPIFTTFFNSAGLPASA